MKYLPWSRSLSLTKGLAASGKEIEFKFASVLGFVSPDCNFWENLLIQNMF